MKDAKRIRRTHEGAVTQDLYTVTELREIARDLELPGRSAMNKSRLREAVLARFKADARTERAVAAEAEIEGTREGEPVTVLPAPAAVAAEDRWDRRVMGYMRQNGTEHLMSAWRRGEISFTEYRERAFTAKQRRRIDTAANRLTAHSRVA